MPDDDVTVPEEQQDTAQAVADPQSDEAAVAEELDAEASLQKKLAELITVAVKDIGPLRKEVIVTVPRAAIDEQLGEQFDELKQDAQVPGFRRGRAPMKLIEKRFGGEVGEQVGSSLVGNSWLAAVERESLDVLGDPMVRLSLKQTRADESGKPQEAEVEKLVTVEEALKQMRLPDEGDFSYVCEVEVRPEFELPTLEKIPVEKPVITIGDEDVEKEVKRRLALRGKLQPVEGGKVEEDDVVKGAARVVLDGTTIHTEEDAELGARDQRYDGLLLDGFGKAATGKKVGDTVGVEVTVPDDYHEVEARGKQARFEIEIAEVKRLEVPELDEEFFAALGFDSADEYKGLVKDQLESAIEDQVKRSMLAQIENHLLENTKMELPEALSQRHTEQLVSREMMNLYARGVADTEISKAVDELRTSARERAANEIRHVFIMDKIAKQEDVSVSEEELNAAIAEIASYRGMRFDRVRDEIIGTNHIMTLYSRIRDEKILERLLNDAEVTEKKVEPEGAKKSASAKKSTKKKAAKKKATKKESEDA
jgi:trigger factor